MKRETLCHLDMKNKRNLAKTLTGILILCASVAWTICFAISHERKLTVEEMRQIYGGDCQACIGVGVCPQASNTCIPGTNIGPGLGDTDTQVAENLPVCADRDSDPNPGSCLNNTQYACYTTVHYIDENCTIASTTSTTYGTGCKQPGGGQST